MTPTYRPGRDDHAVQPNHAMTTVGMRVVMGCRVSRLPTAPQDPVPQRERFAGIHGLDHLLHRAKRADDASSPSAYEGLLRRRHPEMLNWQVWHSACAS